jgi:SAM-dependent methyltransferase
MALIATYVLLVAVLTAVHYPKDTDRSYNPKASSGAYRFYETAYSINRSTGTDYEAVAHRASERFRIIEMVTGLVRQHRLSNSRVLEVGSGRGYLQDVVADYTGLDLSSTAANHYHKPFVAGSATAMPFAESSYDAIWSVWALEHIPEPEKALSEMRRVLKPGGVLILFPAWDCTPWAANGFDARAYSEFNAVGKLVKAAVAFYPDYESTLRGPIRAGRWVQYALGDRTLRYRRLSPNYDVYWQADGDAAVSLDRFETLLWFQHHGDTCLNCGSVADEFWRGGSPLVIRIGKQEERAI